MNSIQTKSSGLFFYLLLLTGLFFLIQVSFLFQFSGFYLADFKGVASHLHIPFKIVPAVLFFLFVQLGLHVAFAFWIWIQALFVGKALNLSEKKIDNLGFVLFFLYVAVVIVANQYFYPHSLFSGLTENVISQQGAKIILWALIGILFFILVFSLFVLQKKSLVAGIFILIFYFCFFGRNAQIPTDASTNKQPNIIIIGIDALRPDFLGFFGYSKTTPHLDNFLNQSTVFSESLTPIARTFPAWVSILLGKYPKQSGIRTDLQDLTAFNLNDALPTLLKQKGYETIFATDETRFSNIDERFGFDKVIVPTIGLDDFLLGTLNDFPLSNLMVNSTLGKLFFPNSYGNRPAYATYDPNSFLNLLKPTLSSSRQKPLFLSIHFCLTHFPYVWNQTPLKQNTLQNYQAAIHRVDQQFEDFLLLLQQNKILDHAIVIVLSDHGEAIELHGDRATDPSLFISKTKSIPQFYPASSDKETVDQSAGHGTDVLSLSQYHTVLAFRLYGLQKYEPHIVSGLVSLLDIKPTILDFLKMPQENLPGNSLQNFILTNETIFNSKKDFFTETDFSPEAVRTAHPEIRKAIFEGIDYFQLDPKTLRFTVRKSMEQTIFSSKQYADYSGDWLLALYPQKNHQMQPILVNLISGKWTDDLNDQFAKKSPAQSMLFQLKGFFEKDIH